jgi:hypothetical protein
MSKGRQYSGSSAHLVKEELISLTSEASGLQKCIERSVARQLTECLSLQRLLIWLYFPQVAP